ncbi:MAG: lipid-A-disaccharide synthase [Bacteroidetes bacterium]|nr:lipid-A-disaccharide synthase [Bacteroidota bacterium]
MKYYLVAGEASGDLHGANLMKTLKQKDPQAEFRFFGGDKMFAEGGELVKHYADMAYMGFIEVVANIRTISRNLKSCKEDIVVWKPDVLVLIDFPGFNLRIAEAAKNAGIMVCYYISPKVWAWNQKRVLKIKRIVDHLFCILPFEVEFYKSWGMDVDYVGNPLLDAINDFKPDPNFRNKHGLGDDKIIALLPGSRRQEISRILPDMVAAAKNFSDYRFVVAGAPSFKSSYYDGYLEGSGIKLVFDSTYDLLNNAYAAVVTSGTAVLETALFNVPQVVVYKSSPISITIARMVIRVKFISLVNLIMDKMAVNELIQQDCNPQKISEELKLITENPNHRVQMLNDYKILHEKMGKPGASARTAELIWQYASKK